ncbi:uncharacterized protein [Nicotiana sylvestris]|uniref:uncharacterized protein n=1 Tax=Nicotiana sylvestris TaxID=4096 RepID=UPI00388CC774
MKKTPEEIVTILDELFEDANQWPSEIAERRRSTGVHQVDTNTSVHVQLDAMAKEIRKLTFDSTHNEPHIYERLDAHGAAIKELGTGLRNLERQVEQIANILSERIPGTLLADTEKNPKETINVVTLRSGGKELKIEDDKKKKGKKGEKIKKEETLRREDSNNMSKHMPDLPFPQKLYREKLDKQFDRFLDMLRQVNVNLPFTEVLSQMLAYAKFLKEILTKKRNIEETSVVKLTEYCSAILQNKLPQKCGDQGSFTIPCSLGTLEFDKYLCDSGSSINLMPLFIYKKTGE